MYEHLNQLNFSVVVSICPDSTGEGASEKGERAGIERRRGEGKEKVEGRTEGRGGRHGNSDGGNCAISPRGIDATGRRQY